MSATDKFVMSATDKTGHGTTRAALVQSLDAAAAANARSVQRPKPPTAHLKPDAWKLAQRCDRPGCRAVRVRRSRFCRFHGGAAQLARDGRIPPATKCRTLVRKLKRAGALPPELTSHPLYIALDKRKGATHGPVLARLALAYLDMLDNGDTTQWLQALAAAQASLARPGGSGPDEYITRRAAARFTAECPAPGE